MGHFFARAARLLGTATQVLEPDGREHPLMAVNDPSLAAAEGRFSILKLTFK